MDYSSKYKFAIGHSGGAVGTTSNVLIIPDDDEKKSDSRCCFCIK